ncbi:MAG: DUF72 domain-containing protein [Thermoprotei archaeon]|nr:MAG: DUF72 domain-containing protein [Thermoprotei archaeon]
MDLRVSDVIILTGCCGFNVSRRKYFQLFKVVELQETFYRPPTLSTLERLRNEAPPDFVFTFKVWQVLTHSPKSPTWKKAKLDVDKETLSRLGSLKPTKENFEIWEKMREIAKVINAKVAIFQTPPSFGYSKENYESAYNFFKSINRDGLLIGWEPRGTWKEHRDILERLISEVEVIHVTDLLREEPVIVSKVMYTRLHGLGPREVNYKYKYTDDDLSRLASILTKYSDNVSEYYVMFNNVYMVDDSLRFKNIAQNMGLKVI